MRWASLAVLLFVGLSTQTIWAAQLNTNQTATSSYLSRWNPKRAHLAFQIGAFDAYQGRAQNIGMEGMIGDRFTVSQHHNQNVLLGASYLVDGLNQDRFSLMYGLNAFYFSHTTVRGYVTQEQLYTNLAYHYSIINVPIYLAAKGLIKTNSDRYNVTVDLGIGPNIINISNFVETPIDAIPDQIFSGRTSAAFSVTAGLGIRFNNAWGHMPVEIGYRFFYLGGINLHKTNNQVTNALNTGNSYANALVVSISS